MIELGQSDYIVLLAQIAAIGIVTWGTPGPNMLAVMSASLSHGRRAGLATGFGIATGGLVWACAAVAGVKVIFTAFPFAELALRIAGGGYLIWLGLQSLRQAALGENRLNPYQTEKTGWHAFLSGFLVMATNPKAALYFGSILTAFVPAEAPFWLLVAIVGVNSVIGFGGQTITATVFSTAPARRFFERARRKINAVVGLLFCGLGAGLIYEAVRKS